MRKHYQPICLISANRLKIIGRLSNRWKISRRPLTAQAEMDPDDTISCKNASFADLNAFSDNLVKQ